MLKKDILTLYSFFNPKERRYLFGLAILMLILALVELLGVGSIFAYISLLTNQDIILEHPRIRAIFHALHFTQIHSFLFFLGICLFFVMLLKGTLSCLNLYFQSKFSSHMNNRLSKEILKSYITMPYQKLLSLNTALLSKNLLIEVGYVVTCITQFLTLGTEMVTAVFLIGLMLWLEPLLILLVVVVLGGATFLMIKYTRNHIASIGREGEQCRGAMFKAAAQALQGLKEIKVFHAEDFFQQEFERPLYRSSDLTVKANSLSGFPGTIMNLMAFGTLLLILLYLLHTKGNLINALPIIGAIGFAVQSLLPSAGKIYGSIILIRRYETGIFIISKTLSELKGTVEQSSLAVTEVPSLQFKEELYLKQISYAYPGARKQVLNNISLKILRNSSVGIIGASGAGKSTLVDVLLGLLPVCEGQIYCDDTVLDNQNRRAFNRLVGYIPQQTFLLDDTISANIAFGVPLEQIDLAQVTKAIHIARLDDFIKQLPQGLNTNIGERGVKLSGGQRQRIGIARALYRNPEILILDEATNALDLATEAEFNASLKELMHKKTLIVIAHRLSSLIFCEQLVLIKDGKIEAAGTLDELNASNNDFRQLYNIYSAGESKLNK
jgi:ATP-binding cassette subfamily C protein